MMVLSRIAFLFAVLLGVVLAGGAFGQSTNQSFPTPVTSNEISGSIKARDVGDARLTSYFYQIDGAQGDLFINVVARNFTGDIDVFTQNGLKHLTKIVVYADLGENETGRIIYLRKPEKMILRVQGRTPGDDAASFRIKFAGSFVASTQAEPEPEPSLPVLTSKNESGIRVNSVGTIVEVIPKATPTPAPAETVSAVVDERIGVEDTEPEKPAVTSETKTDDKPVDTPVETPTETPVTKLEVVVTDNLPETTEPKPVTPPVRRRTRGRTPPRLTPTADTAAAGTTLPPVKTSPPSTGRGRVPPKTTAPKEPDPLEKVNLIILFKDGTTIERPMSEVFRFSVDKGVLTVVAKDGSIGRYSILDVAKLTIQ